MRRAGVTVWREIEEALTREITDGLHPAGTKLPVEKDLAAKFSVNRHTVRRALSSLQDKGLISIEPGRGMFTKSARLPYPVGKRTRFSENVGHLSKYVEGQLLNTWHLAAPEKIAADLDVEVGATLVAIDDLRVLNAEPITLTTHYFPFPRFADLPVIFAETGSITKSLHALGVQDYTRRLTRVYAKEASNDEADLLHGTRGFPVLVVEVINIDSSGRPIEYGYSRSLAGKMEMVFDQAAS